VKTTLLVADKLRTINGPSARVMVDFHHLIVFHDFRMLIEHVFDLSILHFKGSAGFMFMLQDLLLAL
jgi:hypothetical protein